MKTTYWLILVMAVVFSACKDDDNDMNQTVSDDAEVTVSLTLGDDVVEEMNVDVATGGKTEQIVTISSVQGENTITITINDGSPDGSYSVGGSDPGAALSLHNTNSQSPAIYTGTGGSVDVSRFEQVGENSQYNFFEMDCTIDATMQDNQTTTVYTLESTVKNAFISELK